MSWQFGNTFTYNIRFPFGFGKYISDFDFYVLIEKVGKKSALPKSLFLPQCVEIKHLGYFEVNYGQLENHT